MRPFVLFLMIISLSGCVTESPSIVRPEAKAEGPGPVERAENQVAGYVARMPNLYGTRLLQIMQEIIHYKRLALNPILAALPTADTRTQANLIYILGFIKGDGAHRGIMPYLKSKEDSVRFEASVALLNMGDWGGVPILLDFMESSDRRHRFKASEALRTVVKKDFGYEFDAPPPQREKSVALWRGWWGGRREALIYGEDAEKPSKPVHDTGN